jgi:hypothetical protein
MYLEQGHSHVGPQAWLAGKGRARWVALPPHAGGAGLSCTHSTAQ